MADVRAEPLSGLRLVPVVSNSRPHLAIGASPCAGEKLICDAVGSY
jgi:hypothetical protein